MFVNPRRLSHFASKSVEGCDLQVGWGKNSHRGSHRKDMSPLTQGLNYRSACDSVKTQCTSPVCLSLFHSRPKRTIFTTYHKSFPTECIPRRLSPITSTIRRYCDRSCSLVSSFGRIMPSWQYIAAWRRLRVVSTPSSWNYLSGVSFAVTSFVRNVAGDNVFVQLMRLRVCASWKIINTTIRYLENHQTRVDDAFV